MTKEEKDQEKQVIVYYGEGEGKTSAAIGHAIRGSKYGRVGMIQFMKDRKTGEVGKLKKMKNIDFYQFGLETFFTGKNIKQHKEEASKALKKAEELSGKDYFLIVLDEVLNAIDKGLVNEDKVLELLESDCHFILTGRKVSKKVKKKATIITNMKKERHHYEEDKKTVEGIDY